MNRILWWLLLCPFLMASQEPKVLFVSIPKSGTHLLWKAIEKMTQSQITWIGLSQIERFDPERNLLAPWAITGIHLGPEAEHARRDFSTCYNKILILRDPRDVLVSFLHHIRAGKVWKGCPFFDSEKFFSLSHDEQLREILLFPDDCLSPKSSFALAAEWLKDPTVWVCRFEDLVGERGGGSREAQCETLRQLGLRLGLSLSEEEAHFLSEDLYGGTWTYRQGRIGSWREEFSEENQKLFQDLFGQLALDLGYSPGD